MKLQNLLFCLILIVLSAGCKKREEIIIPEPPEGCISLSELKTKQDYYLPFAVINDGISIHSAFLK